MRIATVVHLTNGKVLCGAAKEETSMSGSLNRISQALDTAHSIVLPLSNGFTVVLVKHIAAVKVIGENEPEENSEELEFRGVTF